MDVSTPVAPRCRDREFFVKRFDRRAVDHRRATNRDRAILATSRDLTSRATRKRDGEKLIGDWPN